MFKRNLVLGGLIAGAFLLPNLAVAGGSVTGMCVNCHTMHNSQNGVYVATGTTTGQPAQANLLSGIGCAGCHANPAASEINDGTGKSPLGRPQVDNTAAGSGNILNGGYFIPGAASVNQHDVAGVSALDTTTGTATGFVPPGGSTLGAQLTCQGCHSAAGHHASATGKYRMLAGSNASIKSGTNYGSTAYGATVSSGTRNTVTYQATDMNNFCASCHGLFHGGTDQSVVANVWIRHPTDIQVAASEGPSIRALTPAQLFTLTGDRVVVGSTAAVPDKTTIATASTIMCISCHVPHGGPFPDLLSFNYSANRAGGTDNLASTGCESCHSYGAGNGNGM